MPILKTEILGSSIEINYEEVEKERLIKLIDNFKKRLSDFYQNRNMNDKAIIFLSALKIEDELEESKKLLSDNKINIDKLTDQSDIISSLNNQILLLKKQNNDYKLKQNNETNNHLVLIKEIQNLQSIIQSIQNKIKDELN